MTIRSAQELIDFWFSEAVQPMWFNASAQFDRDLREVYEHSCQAALTGELDHWAVSAQGSLALVILLDQIPLNIWRGQAAGFAGEAPARRIASAAIDAGFDQALSPEQKAFLYLPFMHSEDLADQQRSVSLFTKADLTDNLRWARHHRDIVARFGRFPHRNVILGRESTAEELAWLASGEAFTG
ncbi:MAG TPA: DUF924 domain-containing protein [Gammaproteobacteria bacterium]|nr:DUF924 domain-containing protein [Gammaproteobacteria bacterium]